MLTTSKTPQKIGLIEFSVGLTLLLWLGSKWYYGDWFVNPYKYVAKTASLSATVLMCWSVLLSTRWPVLENYFGGLDKVYQVHKRLGRVAFGVILLHPLFLALDRFPHMLKLLHALWFQRPAGSRYLWGQNVGVLALLGMAALLTVTLWFKIPYHLWKRSHEWFGLVLALVAVHIVLVEADIAAYPLLRVWMMGWLLLALLSFGYIRFGYRHWGPRFAYQVAEIERIGDVLEITFRPQAAKMDFKPSQFVYLVTQARGLPPEAHPYSIACGYNVDASLKLGIKKVGDYTRQLDRLAPGDAVTLYGPYGRFSEKFLSAARHCVFIGGGIGITPFIGMWHVALHSEDRRDPHDLPQPLEHLHPEMVKTWKSPLVSLFYICRTAAEASFDDDIQREIARSEFHGFQAFEARGHHYELYLTAARGRISAEYIDQQVAGGGRDKYIFMCGPSAMVNALRTQFLRLGVAPGQLVIEDFNLV
jgi:predicted ferric reductase